MALTVIRGVADPQALFVQDLARSGLTPEDVPGWRVLTAAEVKHALHAESAVGNDGYLIPFLDAAGQPVLDQGVPFARVRLLGVAKSSEKKPRYLSPAGSSSHLYIPPIVQRLNATNNYIVVTEGEKKAEALCKSGIPAVAICGIDMGLMVVENESVLIKDLEDLAVSAHDKRFVVLFDSDGNPDTYTSSRAKIISARDERLVENKKVFFAAKSLKKALRSAGVAAVEMFCPAIELEDGEVKTQGADDWLLSASAGADVVRAAIELSVSSAAQQDDEINMLREGNEGYIALGKDDDGNPVVFAKNTQRITHLTPQDLSSQAAVINVFGARFSALMWEKKDEKKEPTGKGLNLYAVQKEILSKCDAKGRWTATQERGGGCWLDDGELIINAASGLFRVKDEGFEELDEAARFSGAYAYSSSSEYRVSFEPPPMSAADAANALVSHLKLWGWSNPVQPVLLSGWVAAQALLGALEVRPSISLVGVTGAGKSLLQEHLLKLLSGTAWRITDGASTTEPGVRQKAGMHAKTILLDEAEDASLNTKVADQRAGNLRRILNLMRAAYSTSGDLDTSGGLKGSLNGKSKSYAITTSILLSAIGRPDLEQADVNRLLMFEMLKSTRSRVEPDDSALSEIGHAVRWHLWTRYELFSDVFSSVVADSSLGIEARLRKTWGTPVAALVSLLCDDVEAAKAAALEIMKQVQADQSSAGGREMRTDAEIALKTLLDTKITVEIPAGEHGGINRVERTIFEVYQGAKKSSPQARDNSLGQTLKRHGMLRTEIDGKDVLFVSDNANLRSSMKNTLYAMHSIVSILERGDGAVRTTRETRQKLNGTLVAGVFVPVTAE